MEVDLVSFVAIVEAEHGEYTFGLSQPNTEHTGSQPRSRHYVGSKSKTTVMRRGRRHTPHWMKEPELASVTWINSLPRLEAITCRKFRQNRAIWHLHFVCDSCFGTIKLPKVQIGTWALPKVQIGKRHWIANNAIGGATPTRTRHWVRQTKVWVLSWPERSRRAVWASYVQPAFFRSPIHQLSSRIFLRFLKK